MAVARVDPALDRRAGALEDAPGRPDPLDGHVRVVLAAVERDGRPDEGTLAAPVGRVLDVDPVEILARQRGRDDERAAEPPGATPEELRDDGAALRDADEDDALGRDAGVAGDIDRGSDAVDSRGQRRLVRRQRRLVRGREPRRPDGARSEQRRAGAVELVGEPDQPLRRAAAAVDQHDRDLRGPGRGAAGHERRVRVRPGDAGYPPAHSPGVPEAPDPPAVPGPSNSGSCDSISSRSSSKRDGR